MYIDGVQLHVYNIRCPDLQHLDFVLRGKLQSMNVISKYYSHNNEYYYDNKYLSNQFMIPDFE